MGWNWDAGSGVGEMEFIDLSNPTNDCTTTDFPLPAFGGAGDLVWLMVPGMMKMELLIITINVISLQPMVGNKLQACQLVQPVIQP